MRRAHSEKLIRYMIGMVIPVLLLLMPGCNDQDKPKGDTLRKANLKGEYIYRKHNENLFKPEPPKKIAIDSYPWEEANVGRYPKITKEYFRCKGSGLNPVRIEQKDKETVRYYDCGGAEKHSLPLKGGKEFIYSILIELVNHIQTTTGKRLVITCGHRCPEHNTYSDPSLSNQYSKHMIGAEVSFYVQGMEENPEAIVKIIQEYYKDSPKDYQTFQRYEKSDTNVSLAPWYNKEIFIKLFNKKEGRDFDNRHPYPYISIQVRYDTETQDKVTYSWDKAVRNFQRR